MSSAKKTAMFYFIILSFIITFSFSHSNTTIVPALNNTLVDISSINLSKNMLVSLDKKWIQTDLNGRESECNISEVLSKEIISGYTYHINVILPTNQNYYCILLPDIASEYSVLIDGKTVYDSTDKTGKGLIPHKQMIHFYSAGGITNIKICINSKHYSLTHNYSSILIGLSDTATKYAYMSSLPLLFFIAQITICFIHFIYLYINNYKRKVYLSFALLCLSLYPRALTANPTLFVLMFPNVFARFFYSIDGICAILPLILLIFHTDNLYPKCLNKKLAIPTVLLAVLYCFISIFIPTNYKNTIIIPYVIVTSLTVTFIFITYIKAIFSKENKVILTAVCVFLILFTTILDSYVFLVHHISSLYFIYSYSIYIILAININIRDNIKAYNNEILISRVYSSAINHIKTEETNFLSSHLRPHFLFNALNIISGYSLFDTIKAKAITESLVIYLRQLFEHDNLNELNSLHNEMELVKAFAYIELERFPGLTIEYDIPDDLPDIMIPSLTLQPLLENAINHGVRKKNSKGEGTVIISIRNLKDYIFFSIKDNGAGVNEEVLKKAMTESIDGKFHTLTHISYRLKNLYNENISAKSINGIGTFISFKIPYTPDN